MKSLDADKKASKTSEAAPAEAEKPVAKIDFSKVKVEPLFEEMVDFDTFSKSDFRAVKVKECVAVPKSKKLLQFTLDDGTGTDRTILSGIHSFYEPEELVGKTLIAITNLPPKMCIRDRSMIEAGIDDGDLVVVKKQVEANDGDIVVALVDNQNTLKRYFRDDENKKIILHPENKKMKDIIVDECCIQGVACHIIKEL